MLTFDDQSRLAVERTADPTPIREAIMAARSTGRFTAQESSAATLAQSIASLPA